MKVTIKDNFKAVDGAGKEYDVCGIELNERTFWAKESDHGWENAFKRELTPEREMQAIRMLSGDRITVGEQ